MLVNIGHMRMPANQEPGKCVFTNVDDLHSSPDGRIAEEQRIATTDPAICASGWEARIPIEELFCESFWGRHDQTLMSYTIFDHAEQEISLKFGWERAASVEDLLTSFDSILSQKVVNHIKQSVNLLKESKLGQETLLVPTKVSFFRSVLHDLKSVCDGEDGEQGGDGGDGEWIEVKGRKKSKGEKRDGTESRGQDGTYERSGSGDGDGYEKQNYLTRGNETYFQEAECVVVELGAFTTPTKEDGGRWTRPIKQRADEFSVHPNVVLGHVQYEPHVIDGTVSLYHGTRKNSLGLFAALGIEPFRSFTEFSRRPSFYVTNQIQTAFEYPLCNHHVPGVHHQNTVLVYRFDLDVTILLGRGFTECGERFTVLHFQEEGVEKWTQFCQNNLYNPRQKPHNFDIVIGWMCFPSKIDKKVVVRSLHQLQVAFCTERARKWLGSCLTSIFLEKRD